MARMQSAVPARKVWVGGLVGATTTILIYLIETIAKTQLPSYIAVAISTVMTSAFAYFISPASDDQVVAD
jgi:multisubunit Na+/H+ antiporter MnhB subunit